MLSQKSQEHSGPEKIQQFQAFLNTSGTDERNRHLRDWTLACVLWTDRHNYPVIPVHFGVRSSSKANTAGRNSRWLSGMSDAQNRSRELSHERRQVSLLANKKRFSSVKHLGGTKSVQRSKCEASCANYGAVRLLSDARAACIGLLKHRGLVFSSSYSLQVHSLPVRRSRQQGFGRLEPHRAAMWQDTGEFFAATVTGAGAYGLVCVRAISPVYAGAPQNPAVVV